MSAAAQASAAYRAAEPSRCRLVLVVLCVAAAAGALFLAARAIAPAAGGAPGRLASIAAGVSAALLIGAVVEWFVHRHVMHRSFGVRLLDIPYQLHHRAHHWVQFPPDEYVHEGPVQYPLVLSPHGDRVCTTRWTRTLTVASHAAFYSVFAVVFALLPAWLVTGNMPFTAAVTATCGAIIFLAIHVHDAVHYPGYSPLERFGWFWFLDRHHYVHHVDTGANTNFLLPLGDLLFGTLRRELAPEELRLWPDYPQARARLHHPRFDAAGAVVRERRVARYS